MLLLLTHRYNTVLKQMLMQEHRPVEPISRPQVVCKNNLRAERAGAHHVIKAGQRRKNPPSLPAHPAHMLQGPWAGKDDGVSLTGLHALADSNFLMLGLSTTLDSI